MVLVWEANDAEKSLRSRGNKIKQLILPGNYSLGAASTTPSPTRANYLFALGLPGNPKYPTIRTVQTPSSDGPPNREAQNQWRNEKLHKPNRKYHTRREKNEFKCQTRQSKTAFYICSHLRKLKNRYIRQKTLIKNITDRFWKSCAKRSTKIWRNRLTNLGFVGTIPTVSPPNKVAPEAFSAWRLIIRAPPGGPVRAPPSPAKETALPMQDRSSAQKDFEQ